MSQSVRYFSGHLILLLFLSACGGQPVRRQSSGRQVLNNARKEVPDVYAPVRKKIVLLPIYNESPYGKDDLAIHATEELRRELVRVPHFRLDSEMQPSFGSSKQIYAGAGVQLSQLARKAKLAGVNLVMFGRITHARIRQKSDEIGIVRKSKAYAESEVELRIFDIHTNKEILVEKANGNVNDSSYKFFMSERDSNLEYRRGLLRYSIRVAIRRMIPKLVALGAKLDWTGRVARIIGQKVYINAGRKSGLHIGDVLKVLTEGQEVYDPETGALLGVSSGEVKGTLEITDFFGPDGCVAILHSGGAVTEGDFVQLY